MINLFHAKYFFDAVRLESVSLAAKENHVSQSAVSQAIASLEKQLKTALLHHRRQGLKLTPHGELFFKWISKILKETEEVKAQIDHLEETFCGKITFACPHSVALTLLPLWIKKLKSQAPHIKIECYFGHNGLIKEWIHQGKIDFGIAVVNEDLSAYESEPFYAGRFQLFQSKNRCVQAPVQQAVFPPLREEIFAYKEAYHKKFALHIETEMEISSWEVIAELIVSQPCIGFLPDYFLLDPRWEQLIEPFAEAVFVPYSLAILYPKDEQLSANSRLFATIISSAYRVH